MQNVKPNARELELAAEQWAGPQMAIAAERLARYRKELEDKNHQERLRLELKVRDMEAKVLEVFRDRNPSAFGLEDNNYGRGYMAAIAAMADDTTDQYKDVALRITDRRLRQEGVAFVSFRSTRTGSPTCRVLRISDDGTSEAGEGPALDVALHNLRASPKPDLL